MELCLVENRNERANLEFIRIYLEYRPPSCALRTFVDDWFAYYKGGPFLNKNGKPHWFNNPNPKKHRSALLSMHFVSKAANMVIEGHSQEPLIKEHAVPVKIIKSRLEGLEEHSLSNIREVLLSFYRLGVITKSEDSKLNEAGLRSAMPAKWDESEVFARYQKVGIQ